MMRLLKAVAALVAVLIVGGLVWLYIAPPDLLRVGTNYAAKIVCSNVFLTGRDADEVLATDVQAGGHPILGYIGADVDRETGAVTAKLLGIFATGRAIYRRGSGCASDPGLDATVEPLAPEAAAEQPAPDLSTAIDPAIQAVIEDEDLAGPSVRAIVVLRDGVVVAERYADGFDAETPLLGWSMTKTVTAALYGRLEANKLLTRDDKSLFPAWTNDKRAEIAVADLMGMASDLVWNEGYGSVSDVTRLLYLENDGARFTEGFALNAPDGSDIGDTFNYSSGTSVLLSRYWQDKVGDGAESYPGLALFDPLGMDSAVLERDAAGNFVGGSYMYASARDWARFGQFLIQDGVWNGIGLLPEGYADWMMEPHPASDGAYARGHMWREPPRPSEFRGEPVPAELADTAWLAGHDGQSVALMEKEGLVIVRMGLTPSKLGYRPEYLAIAVKKAAAD